MTGPKLPRMWAALLCAALASCSGRSDSVLPAGNAPLADASARRTVTATLRIKIPKKHRTRRARERGNYISPATQSIAISITPSHGGSARSFNADLTPSTNHNCSASTSTCTITMALAPGKYTGSFQTYDGTLDGNGFPTGNPLSATNGVPITIAVGAPNVIGVALEGIPTDVTLVPSPASSLVGTAPTAYALSRCNTPPQKVSIFGIDADGNFILGVGAPTPSLTTDSSAQLAVATPAPSSPNAFVLTPPAYAQIDFTVHLTAKVTPGVKSGGSSQSIEVDVTFSDNICGVFTEFTLPNANSTPAGITVGPDGALWFAEVSGNRIGRIPTTATAADPQITEFAIPTTSGQPFGITAAGDGALWFTECAASKIGRIPTSGSPIYEFPTVTAGSQPKAIVTGSDGAVWFTESVGSKIGRIPTSGTLTVTEYPIPTASSVPLGIAAGPNGAIWFTESATGKVGTLPTSGTPVTEYTGVPTPGSPRGIAAGSDGALWFAENSTNMIGRIPTNGSPISQYPIPTAGSGPGAITSGPDGALWFSEFNGNKIGRVPTSGPPMTEYTIPTAVSHPFGIVMGPDGALWFTEAATNKIGRLQ